MSVELEQLKIFSILAEIDALCINKWLVQLRYTRDKQEHWITRYFADPDKDNPDSVFKRLLLEKSDSKEEAIEWVLNEFTNKFKNE